jgi:histidyl-tRNA synthetase
VEADQILLKDAPKLLDHLDDESKNDFEIVKEQLNKSKISYIIDPALVRGLDYYTKLTFEIISGSVGAQNALCGGGRYDLLVENLGGKPTPATGFAAGIERILLACENEKSFSAGVPELDVYFVRVDKELETFVSELVLQLRSQQIKVDFDYLQRSVKAQMREANKLNARFVIFIGGDEYKEGKVNIKNMSDGTEEKIPIHQISEFVAKLFQK